MITINNIYKAILSILTCSILALLTSCQKNEIEINPNSQGSIAIELEMPDVNQISTRSNLTSDESKISNIYVAIINVSATNAIAAASSDKILKIYEGKIVQDYATGNTTLYFTPDADITAQCEIRVLANLSTSAITQVNNLKSSASATLQNWINIALDLTNLYSSVAS